MCQAAFKWLQGRHELKEKHLLQYFYSTYGQQLLNYSQTTHYQCSCFKLIKLFFHLIFLSQFKVLLKFYLPPKNEKHKSTYGQLETMNWH